ncbi:cell division protein FtsA [Pelagirhabdus alkalitolerans]|uniref:Cell division protein FtsA n=1 Tax=Pelagirhabdus alkalitolerans TaxID=1612202 RepID=A0A1G6H053_9BACI|nr:cell division protein FtsA [Pelagirhabdus alkalitolerans]SDB87639.1 cell division protein FtsA [Pelagirhabdus alkalitolerans]
MNNSERLVSLDIGTSKIKVVIGEVQKDSLNIIGVGTAKSNGMKKGAIVDIDETVQSIKAAVEEAERMVNMSIDRVIVGINGNHIDLQSCQGIVAVASDDREIGDEDVKRVIDAAQVISIPPEREIIDVIPKQFIVDGLDEITDPRGMIGVRLEMEGTIITCARTMLHNILKCVEGAGLEVIDISLQPLASGAIALSSDEKELGVALIDVGGGSTTVSVFENSHLVATSVIPLGGDNITKDIAIGLKISTEEAEKVKVEHGHSYYPEAMEEETFDVSVIGSDQVYTFNQLELADIIEARMEEIYTYAAREIKKMGYGELPGGFVLTGGCMRTPGALELAQEMYYANVRVAIPDYIGVREPQFTSGVGILKFAHKNAKIQGKVLGDSVTESAPKTEKMVKKSDKLKPKKEKKAAPKQKKESSVANLFKYFFD